VKEGGRPYGGRAWYQDEGIATLLDKAWEGLLCFGDRPFVGDTTRAGRCQPFLVYVLRRIILEIQHLPGKQFNLAFEAEADAVHSSTDT